MLQVVKFFNKRTKIQHCMVQLVCDNNDNTYYVVGTWFYKDGEQVYQGKKTEYYDQALTEYIDKVLEYNQLKDYQQTHYKWS